MKFIYSLLILSLVVVAGCKRPPRSTDTPSVDPATTSSHSIETAPLQNSHLATSEFTPVELPDEPTEFEDPADLEDPTDLEDPADPDDGSLPEVE